MNRTFVFVAVALFAVQRANAQNSQSSKGDLFKDILRTVKHAANDKDTLSSLDIAKGLKEALQVGARTSTGRLSAIDGFFKDAAVKILLPTQVQKVEKLLRNFGAEKLVDDAIFSLNRAAEDAAKKATPIFLSAIQKMTISDAWTILSGSDTSATAYLKRSTSLELSAAFKPVIDSSLEHTNATKYWEDVFGAYNKFSSSKIETDLSAYVTQKAMDGIFYYIGKEEKNIRKDPKAYASDLLIKVFDRH